MFFSTFYRCPICDAKDCNHHESATPIKLNPCPFCQGPPVPFATSERAGFVWEEDGTMVEVHVFCHECGAQGPGVEALLDDESEVPELVARAVLLWQTQNARHRSLYNSSDKSGRNLYPRADDPK